MFAKYTTRVFMCKLSILDISNNYLLGVPFPACADSAVVCLKVVGMQDDVPLMISGIFIVTKKSVNVVREGLAVIVDTGLLHYGANIFSAKVWILP
jgi:hypothetical protein